MTISSEEVDNMFRIDKLSTEHGCIVRVGIVTNEDFRPKCRVQET